MKKETKLKIAEFKNRKSGLILTLKAEPENQKVVADMQALNSEIVAWLQSIAGEIETMTAEEKAQVEKLIKKAHEAIHIAGRRESELVGYIHESAKRAHEYQPGYERIVDDKGQMSAIAEQCARNNVAKIEKFNKKRNKKSFLNIVICKFKKSKQQSQESDKVTEGPING